MLFTNSLIHLSDLNTSREHKSFQTASPINSQNRILEPIFLNKFSPNVLHGRTEPQLSTACCVGSVLHFRSCVSWPMTEFVVCSLTYAHRSAQPVYSLTLTGCGQPPTATILARGFINIRRRRRSNPAL